MASESCLCVRGACEDLYHFPAEEKCVRLNTLHGCYSLRRLVVMVMKVAAGSCEAMCLESSAGDCD